MTSTRTMMSYQWLNYLQPKTKKIRREIQLPVLCLVIEINFKSLSVLVLYFTVNADQCDDIIIDYPADELIDEIVRQKRKEQFGGKLTAPRRHRQEWLATGAGPAADDHPCTYWNMEIYSSFFRTWLAESDRRSCHKKEELANGWRSRLKKEQLAIWWRSSYKKDTACRPSGK